MRGDIEESEGERRTGELGEGGEEVKGARGKERKRE